MSEENKATSLYMRKRVLVVEDDPQGSKLIGLVLRKLGVANVENVTNGQEALDAIDAATEKFDLVISDWNMPVMTGIQLLSRVRKTHYRLPFIIITGRGTGESAVEAKMEGVTSFISKPYTPHQLISKITAVFDGDAKNPDDENG